MVNNKAIKSKVVAISQSNYIPWKGYFDFINQVDEFVIYDEMQYTRRDWRNRNKIKYLNETKWLSIPVKVKGNYHSPINAMQLSDPGWSKRHLDTIKQAYRLAPYFKWLMPHVEFWYEQVRVCRYLTDVNVQMLKQICGFLKIETKITTSVDIDMEKERTLRLVEMCKKLGATDYLSGPAAKTYLNTALLKESNISVRWMDYSSYPEYEQLSPPFEHGVSILDVLFNCGPRSSEYIFIKKR